MASLSWSLCVATRNRPRTLEPCLRAAAAQQPPPSQVIVVDASDADARSDRLVLEDLPNEWPGIDFRYEHSAVGSLTIQRQRSIELSHTDIVFTFDDDTIMFPGCAAALLELYEADETGAVVGVEASEWAQPPRGIVVDDSADPFTPSPRKPEDLAPLRRLAARAVSRLAGFDPRDRFIPYDGDYPDHPVPPSVRGLDAYRVPLLEGYRMTYRRAAVADLELEQLFRAYTPMEDYDLSYRASRQGALVASMRGGVYHHRARSGRLSRADVDAKSVLNLALLLRRHAPDRRWATRRLRLVSARRVGSGLLRDGYRRRWSFPTVRGTVRGTRNGLKVLRAGDDTFEETYRRFQERYL